MSIPKEIVTQARTWLGTPFHHQARLKGKGCDCLGLVVGVVDELQIKDKTGRFLSEYDEINYSKQPDGDYLVAKLSGIFEEVTEPQAGDLGLFMIRNNPQHLAIFSDFEDGLGIIHCYTQVKKVVEHRFDKEWQSQLIKVFRWQL